MTYLCILAQGMVCHQAAEEALPLINETYKEDLRLRDLFNKIGYSKIFNRQVELRKGRILGVSREFDRGLIHRLAQEIPEMYRQSRQSENKKV